MVQVYQQAKKLIKKDWKKTSVRKMYEEITAAKKKEKKRMSREPRKIKLKGQKIKNLKLISNLKFYLKSVRVSK